MDIQRWGSGVAGRNHTVARGDTVWTVANASNLQGGFREQASEALAVLQSFLAQAGTDKSQLLSVQVVLANITDREEFNEIWCAWVGPNPGHWPQRAVIGAALAPGLLVELMAIAARPDGPADTRRAVPRIDISPRDSQ